MQIRIPALPPRVQAMLDRYLDWINVPIYKRMRRIDVVLFFFGVFCVAYYSFYSTPWWHGALLGGSMYLLVMMVALWFF